MSFTIICIGLPEKPVQGTYTSAGFDAAVHADLGSAVLPYNGRRYLARRRHAGTGYCK